MTYIEIIPLPLLVTIICYLAGILFLIVYFFIMSIAVTKIFPEKYPARKHLNPKCWSSQTVIIGRWKSRNTVSICADSEALHISLPFLKSFSIPWHEIEGQRERLLLGEAVKLQCQKIIDIPIYIKRSLADQLIEVTGGAWRYDGDVRGH